MTLGLPFSWATVVLVGVLLVLLAIVSGRDPRSCASARRCSCCSRCSVWVCGVP